MPDHRFVFVSGCPRSGTTMVTTLLNWSDEVFIAQERYAPLVRREPEALRPSLFDPGRLRDFRPRECGYASFASKQEYWISVANPKNLDALGEYRVLGDKITHLFRRFDLFRAPDWASKDVTVVHVIRNVRAVVASYLARKADESDPWPWGEEDAVRDWTDAVEHAHAFHQDGSRAAKLLLVDYDWMTGGDEHRFVGNAGRLFAALDLGFRERERGGATGLYRQEIPRKLPLPGDLRERIDAAIDSGTIARYEELKRWSIR